MTISVLQTCFRQQVYSQSFGSNVTAGSSVVLAISAFTTSGSTIGSSAPTFNGSAVPGAVKLIEEQSAGSNGTYVAIWLLPNLAGGSAGPVAITVTNGGSATAIGITAWEVAGLGATPALDQSHPATATSGTTVASGATPPTTGAPEFVAGIGVSFGNSMGGAGAPWTEPAAGVGGADSQAGYQVATSSGGTFSYSQTAGGSAGWAAVVVTITAGGGAAAAASVPPPPQPPMQHPGLPGMPGGIPFAQWPPLPGTAPAQPPVPPQPGTPPPPPLPLPPALPGPGLPGMPGGTAFETWPPAPLEAGAVPPSPVNYITGLAGSGAASYFADQHGTPRLVLGDEAWGLPANAGEWNGGNWAGDYDAYLTSRAAQGFTVLYCKPMGNTVTGGSFDNGNTWDGVPPFTTGRDPASGLNTAFWARIDYLLAKAGALGITVFLNLGQSYDNATGGLQNGWTTTQWQTFGGQMGARYKDQANLVWLIGDDSFGGDDASWAALLTGIRAAGDTHVIAPEYYSETTSRQDLSDGSALTWGAANAQFNFVYSYNVSYYGVEQAYLESSPLPAIHGDGYFYQNQGTTAEELLVRSLFWWALSSGARGFIFGSEGIWQWGSGSPAAVTAETFFATTAAKIRAAFEGLAGWHLLIPDTSSALVTAGRGTRATSLSSGGGGGEYTAATDARVTASLVPDGSLAVIYMSHASTITVDQTKMAAGYTATWVDPASGTATSGTAGSSYNSGARGSNSAGGPDWVLVLQAPAEVDATATATAVAGAASIPVPSPIAGSVVTATAVGGAASIPAPAISAAPAPAAVAGGASIPAPGISSAAAPAPVTGAASVGTPGLSGAAAPAAVAGAASIPAPRLSGTAAPAAVTGTASIPAPALTSTAAPAAVTGTASLGTPALSSSAGPAAVAGAASIPVPSVSAGGSATPAATAVTGAASIPVPAPSAGSAVAAAAVAAAVSVPLPAVAAGAVAAAASVTGAASVGAARLNAGAGPAAVTAAAAIPVPAVTADNAVIARPAAVDGSALIPVPQLAAGAIIRAIAVAVAALIGVPVIPVGQTITDVEVGAPRQLWSVGEPHS